MRIGTSLGPGGSFECLLEQRVGFSLVAAIGTQKAVNRRTGQSGTRFLGDELERLHEDNYGIYGVRKMHHLMRRQGWLVGRDQVARVMKTRGITGVRRGKTTFTTKTKPADSYPADEVNRQFVASRPCQLWVADITYVATWAGMAYVAFVTDVFSRKIVGWSVSATLRTDMLPLQALNMAAWHVDDDLHGLVHHSDRGSNYVALAYTDRIVELGGTPSVGSKGDSYEALVLKRAPHLLDEFGIGVDTAAEILIVAGDNPDRIRSEAAFAKLAGISPVPTGSGMTSGKHRINHGGHRQLNAAIYRTVIVSMQHHEPTKAYVARRTAEGKSKRDIIRCLKRYVIREVYHLIKTNPKTGEIMN